MHLECSALCEHDFLILNQHDASGQGVLCCVRGVLLIFFRLPGAAESYWLAAHNLAGETRADSGRRKQMCTDAVWL
jgi:hypothetical protein